VGRTRGGGDWLSRLGRFSQHFRGDFFFSLLFLHEPIGRKLASRRTGYARRGMTEMRCRAVQKKKRARLRERRSRAGNQKKTYKPRGVRCYRLGAWAGWNRAHAAPDCHFSVLETEIGIFPFVAGRGLSFLPFLCTPRMRLLPLRQRVGNSTQKTGPWPRSRSAVR